MEVLIEFLNSLSPEQQAVLAGLVVSGIMYVLRLIPYVWGEITDYGKKKVRGTMVAVVLAAITTVIMVGPEFALAEFVWMFVINFFSSQGGHSAAKNARRLTGGE